jgi:type VI secretion system protein ImpL
VIVSGDTGQPPAMIERNGAWSLFRLVEAGGPVIRGDQVQVSYLVGGRELNYRIASGSAQNPFNHGLLRDFHCPAGL